LKLTQRSALSSAFVLGVSAACASAGFSCSKPVSEAQFVAGFQTQVKVPRDLKSVMVKVTSLGNQEFCRAYPVIDGQVKLPQSLGTLPRSTESTLPVEISIIGMTTSLQSNGVECPVGNLNVGAEASPNLFGTDGTSGIVRVLRRSIQQYIPGKKLYVPMPLKYSCFEKECDATSDGSKTCKAGLCVPAQLDSRKLIDFRADLLEGSGNQCFRQTSTVTPPQFGCFDAPLTPKVIKPDTCLYEVPEVPGVPFKGVNVRAVYEGGFQTEVLDLDDAEGFTIPDPSKPRQFQLVEGLCNAVKALPDVAHPITSLTVTGVCLPKTPLQPMCDDEAQLLVYGGNAAAGITGPGTKQIASPAALDIVLDLSQGNKKTFDDNGLAQLLIDVGLSDTSLDSVYMGLRLLPAVSNVCTAGTPEEALAQGSMKRKAIGELIRGFIGAANASKLRTGTDLGINVALANAYAALQTVDVAKRRTVVVGNGNFSSACLLTTGQLTTKAAFLAPKSVTTSIIVTGDGLDATGAGTLANEGGTTAQDGTGGSGPAVKAFADIAAELTTCNYEKGVGFSANGKLAYYNPTAAIEVLISANAACTEASGEGWILQGDRIVMCGASCTTLRTAVTNNIGTAIALGQAPQAIPVYLRQP
jgi:hypothetical protein